MSALTERTDFHRVQGLETRIRELEAEASFLLARLSEVNFSDEPDELSRDWDGHVEPSIARMRSLLAKRE